MIPAGLVVVAAVAPGTRGARRRTPADFKASALLAPAQVRGPHHVVADAVPTPDFFHEFTITSDFGTFEADGAHDAGGPAARD